MGLRALVLVLVASIAVAANAQPVEKPASLNGTQYAVIAPVYDGSNGGSESFIRLFNAQSTSSTFNVTVVNANNGIVLGAAAIQVPSNASPQYPLTPAGGSNSIFTQAGVADSAGTSYALYLQDTDQYTGYEHVTFNGASTLFENNSVCGTTLDQQTAANNVQVLTNVHTSQLSGYPSIIAIHNYANTATTVKLTVYDAATGSSIGNFTQAITANETLTIPESQIETQLNFHPTSAQPHINVFLTNNAGGSLPVDATLTIHNTQYGGEINMSAACAMNAVPATVVNVAPSVPTAYCGTATYAAYPTIPVAFTASVAPDGAIRVTAVGQSGNLIIYGSGSATLNGTSFTVTESTGSSTGTVSNGVISGTGYSNQLGSGTFYGTTAGCG